MPSALDLRIDNAIASLSVEGGPMPLGSFTLPCGVAVPTVAAAPPHLNAYFAHFCAQHGDADFIVDGEERISFRQAYAAATDVAHALVSVHGVKKGDRVGIAMRNAPSWVILYMGTLMAGGVATLLNGWWQGGELCAGISDVGCTLAFADLPRAKRLEECGSHPGCDVVIVDVALPLDQALEPVLKNKTTATLPDITGDDLATILFTSGSTGQSKGAYSTHRAVMQGTFCYIMQALMQLQIGTEDGIIKEPRPQHAVLMMPSSVPICSCTSACMM